ncbi:MAG: hypothetical protein ABI127_11370 [Dokdonella sp.]
MDIDMARICQQCGERPAAACSPRGFSLLSILLPGRGFSERLCNDCAGGRKFVGTGLLIAIAMVAFILAVILW